MSRMTKYVVTQFTLKRSSGQYVVKAKISSAYLKNRALKIITSKYLRKLPFIKTVVHFFGPTWWQGQKVRNGRGIPKILQ